MIINKIMQITYSDSPDLLVLPTKETVQQTSFETFINKFKSTLKKVFHKENDIDQLSI